MLILVVSLDSIVLKAKYETDKSDLEGKILILVDLLKNRL